MDEGLMDEAGQPLGRASPDDESGLEPRFSVPSAVGGNPLPTPSTIRSSRAFKHPNGAALRIAPLFGPALSDHVRAGPLPTGFAESREGRSRDEAPASYSRRARPLRRDLPHALCGDPGALKSYATLLGHRRSCAPGRRRWRQRERPNIGGSNGHAGANHTACSVRHDGARR